MNGTHRRAPSRGSSLPAYKTHAGFTLVELLVVITIIAMLVGVLVPALRAARDQAKRVKCMAGLHSVGQAVLMYADDNWQQMPGYSTMGMHSFRIAPGRRLMMPIPGGQQIPSPYPEAWGLQAVLHTGTSPRILPNGVAVSDIHSKPMYLASDSKVWICPANPGPLDRRDFKDWGNTYAYRCNSGGGDPATQRRIYNVDHLSLNKALWKNPIVWDNYKMYPGDPGFNGPFDRYTIDDAFVRAPHRSSGRKGGPSQFWCAFYLDGHCQMNGFNQ